MLNLSDKELDRLSREAAQEHDPGDVLGSRSWEKLEPRLDRDLGKSGPNPLRGVRRFPFYYVPAILLVAGVFYVVKQNHSSKQNGPSGSPPSATVQSTPATETQPLSTTQNPEHSLNSTPPATTPAAADPTIANPATANPAASDRAAAPATGANPVTPNSAAANPATANSAKANPATTNSAAPNPAAPNANASSTAHSATPTHTSKTTHYPGTTGANNGTSTNSASTNSANPNTTNTTTAAAATTAAATTTHTTADKTKTGTHIANNIAHTTHSGRQHRGKNIPSSTTGANKDASLPNNITATVGTTSGAAGTNRTSGANDITNNNGAANNNGTASTNNKPRELTLSTIHSTRSLRQRPAISDSALRAYTAKTSKSLIQPGKNKSLRINRTLQFGLTLAPDFSSVNSLAGDKPGSSFGLTVDYQFANHWYLSTGLLLDRKNYAARQQDYHVPPDFYRMNNMHNVDFVKGSFNMLEIPLNLRYDFSVTGSTLFFASAGFSSYLLTNENSNYYFNWYGREDCRSFNYSNNHNYLFSSINLSLGVETGISNSMSLLIAPYVKIPSRNIGFGQVQMNSVGINFALKFAPVISRKRK